MTFKELLDQCSWEDLEDFLYEFPDVGMDEGCWKADQGDEHLPVQLQRLLGKHGELLVRNAVEMDTRKVMADIDQSLTNPLVVTYRPGVYQFTSRL